MLCYISRGKLLIFEGKMDKLHYDEMLTNLNELISKNMIQEKTIYLFGHCNATEELAELLLQKGYEVFAILDNNIAKQGTCYKGILIVKPDEVLKADADRVLVCIVARAYAAMAKQLKQLGYTGAVKKLVDYNSYAEYSLSPETMQAKKERLARGMKRLEKLKQKYPGCFQIYCPFSALGDVYYAMAYLPYFLEKRNVKKYVVFTIGSACAEVVRMFGAEHVEALSQTEIDETIQAVLYTQDKEAFISHQDRPYVVKLYKALYLKKIPLEVIYKCGVYGLPVDTIPYKPCRLKRYEKLEEIPKNKAVVLSPYAKSVTNISKNYWQQVIDFYKEKGYAVYTNTAPEEMELPGTIRLEVKLSELQSVVERAGVFIGLRSGLCDVIKEADCKKIALYPDCCYSDTKWKMEEIYHLDGWDNIVVK